MKLSPQQIQVLAEKILHHWKAQHLIIFRDEKTAKDVEKQVLHRIVDILKDDYAQEDALDKEVHKMLDQLEASNSGEFQRFKMFPILKQKLAKERKVIL